MRKNNGVSDIIFLYFLTSLFSCSVFSKIISTGKFVDRRKKKACLYCRYIGMSYSHNTVPHITYSVCTY